MMDVHISKGAVGATVQLFGCMVTTQFELGGKAIRPLYEAPWSDFPDDPMLAHLKGDFLCVPFGHAPESLAHFPHGWSELSPGETPQGHGYAANRAWDVEWARDESARFRLDYPADDPVEWVAREVTCTGDAVAITDEIAMRADARLPLGLHPMMQLPDRVGAARLTPPPCRTIASYPVPSEDTSILKPSSRFLDLSAAPLSEGGTIDLTRLPLDAMTEELILLCDVTKPEASLDNLADGYRLTMSWDSALLKHCLLWVSNRGRSFAPWNSRNLCLGIEPVTSAFELGPAVSAALNPLSQEGISTAVDLHAGDVRSISHRLSASLL